MYLAARAAHDLGGELRKGHLPQSARTLLVGGTERRQLGLCQTRARAHQLVDGLLPLHLIRSALLRSVLAAVRAAAAARAAARAAATARARSDRRGVVAAAPTVLLRAQRLVRLG